MAGPENGGVDGRKQVHLDGLAKASAGHLRREDLEASLRASASKLRVQDDGVDLMRWPDPYWDALKAQVCVGGDRKPLLLDDIHNQIACEASRAEDAVERLRAYVDGLIGGEPANVADEAAKHPSDSLSRVERLGVSASRLRLATSELFAQIARLERV